MRSDEHDVDPARTGFSTDDLHQAAYLWCHGFEPQLLPTGTRVHFSFRDSRAGELVDDYVQGNGLIEPLRFSAAIRELKRRARECVR